MIPIRRSERNPILRPDAKSLWRTEAAFNPSVVRRGLRTHLVYRAVSGRRKFGGAELEVSSIGYAWSRNGVDFRDERPLVVPEKDWEKYGCEDPRVTEFEGRYYVFYTALSTFPFSADGIRIGVAVTKDFKDVEKHPVTPFNAKAMALFPERIGGKIAAVLTVDTDRPPAKICLALFDRVEDIWSESYWKKWYRTLDDHVIMLERGEKDQFEVGAPPLKTKRGWLIFYSYIYNYFSPPPVFGVQAALLDLKDPRRVVGEVQRPFLTPDREYERYGRVPNIVFPSGAFIKNGLVHLYYGAADTTSCVATLPLKDVVEQLLFVKERELERFTGNPIVQPNAEHPWEAKATFNAGALYAGGRVHLFYRAMSADNTSVLGYASSADGLHFDERPPKPVYIPRAKFEKKSRPGNSGCEDPRLTLLGDKAYMCYTAFDNQNPPRVALTSIKLNDLLGAKWDWEKPVLISPPDLDDKDTALFPEKIGGKYVFLHRLGSDIWIDSVRSLATLGKSRFLKGRVLMSPRDTSWDSKRIGIAGPPIKTKAGWLLLYHGISRRTNHYNLRAALLDLKDPGRVLYRTHDAILEPQAPYEKSGLVSEVVFSCGSVVIKGELFVYYGGADKVLGVATVPLRTIVNSLRHEARFHRRT